MSLNFKQQFKAAYSVPYMSYLNQYKMEQAKVMLMGYKPVTHFTSAFKKYFGYLPDKIKMLMLIS